MGLLFTFRQKDILREAHILESVCGLLIYESPTVTCAALSYPRFPLFHLFILTLIMVKLIGLIQEKKSPRKNSHTAHMGFYEVELTYTILNYCIFPVTPSDLKLWQ